jgi:hypothetical protein
VVCGVWLCIVCVYSFIQPFVLLHIYTQVYLLYFLLVSLTNMSRGKKRSGNKAKAKKREQNTQNAVQSYAAAAIAATSSSSSSSSATPQRQANYSQNQHTTTATATTHHQSDSIGDSDNVDDLVGRRLVPFFIPGTEDENIDHTLNEEDGLDFATNDGSALVIPVRKFQDGYFLDEAPSYVSAATTSASVNSHTTPSKPDRGKKASRKARQSESKQTRRKNKNYNAAFADPDFCNAPSSAAIPMPSMLSASHQSPMRAPPVVHRTPPRRVSSRPAATPPSASAVSTPQSDYSTPPLTATVVTSPAPKLLFLSRTTAVPASEMSNPSPGRAKKLRACLIAKRSQHA